MTREEAIKELKEYEDGLDLEYATPFDKAILHAIKALEQKPTTKNDLAVDCIDRVELLKAMNTYDKFGNDSNERLIFLNTPELQDRYVPYVHYDEMVNCVKGMSPVTPQEPRVHAKILIKPNPRDEYSTYYHCSNCNEVLPRYYDKLNYCPNCGAKIVTEESELKE